MDLHTLLLDGFVVLALASLAALLVGGLALSLADLTGRDLADGSRARRRSGSLPTPEVVR